MAICIECGEGVATYEDSWSCEHGWHHEECGWSEHADCQGSQPVSA